MQRKQDVSGLGSNPGRHAGSCSGRSNALPKLLEQWNDPIWVSFGVAWGGGACGLQSISSHPAIHTTPIKPPDQLARSALSLGT